MNLCIEESYQNVMRNSVMMPRIPKVNAQRHSCGVCRLVFEMLAHLTHGTLVVSLLIAFFRQNDLGQKSWTMALRRNKQRLTSLEDNTQMFITSWGLAFTVLWQIYYDLKLDYQVHNACVGNRTYLPPYAGGKTNLQLLLYQGSGRGVILKTSWE